HQLQGLARRERPDGDAEHGDQRDHPDGEGVDYDADDESHAPMVSWAAIERWPIDRTVADYVTVRLSAGGGCRRRSPRRVHRPSSCSALLRAPDRRPRHL